MAFNKTTNYSIHSYHEVESKQFKLCYVYLINGQLSVDLDQFYSILILSCGKGALSCKNENKKRRHILITYFVCRMITAAL